MKLKLFIGFLFIHCIASAQIKKDQWIIGGNGAFSYLKSTELKFTSWQLFPSAGYFLADKLAAGLRGGFSSDSYDYDSEKFRISAITAAPFLRYYFLPADQKVNLLSEASFGYSWAKHRNFYPQGVHRYHYYNIGFMAGPAIFLNEHTALEVTVGYNYLSRGPVDSTVTQKFQVGLGLQIHIGK